MTCSFHVSLLFDLSIKLLSELMILSSALMNSRFVVDFDLRKREKFWFSIFDLQRSHLWNYWVEWELVLIVRLCSITCRLIWYIICFDRSLSPELANFATFMSWCVYMWCNDKCKFKEVLMNFLINKWMQIQRISCKWYKFKKFLTNFLNKRSRLFRIIYTLIAK